MQRVAENEKHFLNYDCILRLNRQIVNPVNEQLAVNIEQNFSVVIQEDVDIIKVLVILTLLYLRKKQHKKFRLLIYG